MSGQNKLFESALAAEGVSGKLGDLARSIYAQESGGGKNTQTSNRGAQGGMQILPGTFGQVADKGWSIDDPEHNARAGIRYLKLLDKQSGGIPELTAAGYYGGPGGLEKARRGVAVSDPMNPNAPDTLRYGREVVARMGGGAPSQAAPAALPAGATLQVAAMPAPQADPGPVPLPPEMLAALASRAPAGPSQGGSTADAWQAFLSSMPRARQPVDVASLDYLSPQVMPAPEFRSMASLPARAAAPNFDAFSSWKGRAA